MEEIIKAEELLKLGHSVLKSYNIPSYKLDARILLCTILNLKENYFIPNITVSNASQEKFFSLLDDRAKGKPVSRLISKRNFWNSEFFINSSTLDPRPDSETLVESVLELRKTINKKKISILELGIGSGCILLSILNEISDASGIGIDIDFNAIKVAKKNSLKLDISNRVKFLVSNWTRGLKGKFDIIISNPPYIKSKNILNLQKEVKDYDPLLALDGGLDGLDSYRLIFRNIKNQMKKNSYLLFEIDGLQGKEVIELSNLYNMKLYSKKYDLSGKERCLIFKQF